MTEKGKITIIVLTAYFLGIIISLVQILPSLEIYKNSIRSGLFSNEGAIPLSYLITLVAPDFYGNPVTRNDWVGNYAEWASFIGIVPLVLSLIPVMKKKIKPYTLFFFLIGIISLILALSTPLQALLTHMKVPVFSTSIPSRIIVLFSFAFIVLAAFGLDHVKDALEKNRQKNILLICAGFLCFIVMVLFSLFVFHPIPKEKAILGLKNTIIPFVLIIAISLLFLLKLKIKSNVYNKVIIFSLIVLTLIDSFRFAQKWMPFDPKDLVFPDLPVITAMQQKAGQGRVFGKFGSYIDTYYRLPSIEGYDPLYLQRYGEFIQSAKAGTYQPAVKSLAVLDKRGKFTDRVLNLLGVTVLFHVIGDTGKDWAYPVWKKNASGQYQYSVIYQDDKFQLYRNKDALPRTAIFHQYEIVKGDKNIISRFYSDTFNYRRELILEDDPHIQLSSSSSEDSHASIINYSPDKIIIQTQSKVPALLFLSDNYYPAWHAKVNGKETKIYRADYTFRAVIIPKGQALVEFYYNPWSAI